MAEPKLFLLDGMALLYRAHFAFIRNPIVTSGGLNTSAIYGFTNTLVSLIETERPTHLAVALDTDEPTERHRIYPDYKAHREALPEDIEAAFPWIEKVLQAFRVPRLVYPGYEADDIIGTLARQAEQEGFLTYLVTPDKDFAQLVDEKTVLHKPSRQGTGFETFGLPEVLASWSIRRIEQVIDVLALMGDTSDNIPGIPGVGEKTAKKLISEFDSVEALLDRTGELKGKLKERVEAHREQALLSKKLVTIDCAVPVRERVSDLVMQPLDREALEALFAELEFNSLGRRLLGEDYKSGRAASAPSKNAHSKPPSDLFTQGEFDLSGPKTITEVPHDYRYVETPADQQALAAELAGLPSFCFDTETTGLDPKSAELVGLSFAWKVGAARFVPVPADREAAAGVIEIFRGVLENPAIGKTGHHLKYDSAVLAAQGVELKGPLFDTMLAHALVDPDRRHKLDLISEELLGYAPIPITRLIGEKDPDAARLREVPLAQLSDYACEDADITLQLRNVLEPRLKEQNQERVFYDIEVPLTPVLVDMEREGIRIDAAALAEASESLGATMTRLEARIQELAGTSFNLNSPKQLGQILFDFLKLDAKPRKTRTGQYATDEQVLSALAAKHEIAARILEYREAAKLKSTYVDSLPTFIFPGTGRVHTTFGQAQTATGRLQSQNPNLQNIPIRSEQGQEIRKAFVPRSEEFLLLSADYSQIELRILAALSGDEAMREAFVGGQDIHTATAARVFGVALEEVDAAMRRKAKMVNYGLAYGMSAFGLSQRLGISRSEAAQIMEQYFAQFPGIRGYIDACIAFARDQGYAETRTGRRRYLRDIDSRNGTLRGGAERNAINMPIQGTAADLIKLAMIRIHRELRERGLRSRMLLQVHDELVFDVHLEEVETVCDLVREGMTQALPLDVPMEVEIGTGRNWLEAH